MLGLRSKPVWRVTGADQYGLHRAVQADVDAARTGIVAAGISLGLVYGQAVRAVETGTDVLQFLSAALLVGKSAAASDADHSGGIGRPGVVAGGDIADTAVNPGAACPESG